MIIRRLAPTVLLLLLFAAAPVLAQNTGGVFGPVVNPSDQALQYRFTYDPDLDGWAQRLHYEKAVNGDFMLRGVVQTRKTEDSDLDLDYVQGELFWDLSEDDAPWRTGLRFDLRVRNGSRPEMLGINWMNQWSLANGYSARFLVLTAIEDGDNARDGVLLQTRASLYRRFGQGPLWGLELYNSYGSTDDLGGFDEQRHQIGPAASFRIGDGRSLYTNVLLGLTDITPDAELRFWFTQKF
ncbi:MAG: hypothetical protein AAGM22_27265 [Acidobacteriota bacterium]